jgi:hypothetical protein
MTQIGNFTAEHAESAEKKIGLESTSPFSPGGPTHRTPILTSEEKVRMKGRLLPIGTFI